MNGFVRVNEEELYSVNGRGGSSNGSSSKSSSGSNNSSQPGGGNYGGSGNGGGYATATPAPAPKPAVVIYAPYDQGPKQKADTKITVTTVSSSGVRDYSVAATTHPSMRADNPPMYKNVQYAPVPIPPGTYSVDTKMSGNSVKGYHIDVAVDTKLSNNKVVSMSDFYVHDTSSSYTWGCPGIQTSANWGGSQSNWDKVSNSIAKSGSTSLVITK